MQYLNYVVFKIREKEVKVKHILIPIIILLLLLLLCKCQRDNDKGRKELLEDMCLVSSNNLNDLERLINASNICDEAWFDDVDSYVDRLTEQDSLLKDKADEKDKKIYELQEDIIDALEDFEEEQNDKTLDVLQRVVEEYQKLYEKNCQGRITSE